MKVKICLKIIIYNKIDIQFPKILSLPIHPLKQIDSSTDNILIGQNSIYSPVAGPTHLAKV